jgi:DNA-binding SARP family transcriptional activator/tetratricopeptide (TPR) repeat protein
MDEDPAATTSIRLCGKFAVTIRGRDVTDELGGKQGRAVLACLVLRGASGASRDELIDVLWPRNPPQSPARGLDVVVSRLRAALGPGVIVGRPHLTVQLDPGAEIDVEVARRRLREAEQALAAGEFERARTAVDLAAQSFTGPLLPGLEGEWVDDHRTRFEDLKLRLRRAGIQAGLGLGGPELDRVVADAAELVEEQPTSETAAGLLMRALAARGDRSTALEAYETLRARLRDELGTTPSPKLASLHAELLQDVAAPAAAAPGPALVRSDRPFVGRDAELELLRERWGGFTPDRWPMVLVEGEAGIGKTALAERFASLGDRMALRGRCDEDPIVPYQPFVEALGGQGPGAESLEPLISQLRGASRGSQATVPPEFQQYVMFEGVAERLCRLSHARPLLLVIDDLQWADKPTVKLLQHLARRALRIMLVGTFRGGEVGRGHPLRELMAEQRRQQRLDVLRLEGLSQDETDALVKARIAEPAPDLVTELWEQTVGNPLFIEETLRSLAESGAGAADEPVTARTLEEMGVAEGVKAVILRRLDALPEAPQEALRAAAAIGHVFDLALVAEAAQRSLGEVVEAFDGPAMGGLVEELEEYRFAFAHAIVRMAIYEDLSGTRRARLHERIGTLLEEQPREPGQAAAVALHLTRGGSDPARIVRHEVRAGQEAARACAYEEAAGHFERAAGALGRLGPDHEHRRAEVLLMWASVLSRAGRSKQATEKFRAVAASARARGAAEQLANAALGVGQRYWEANINDPAYRGQLEEALARLATVKCSRRVRLLSTRLSSRLAEHLAFVPGEDAHARALSADAVAIAEELGEPDTLINALMARHVTLLHIEHVDERLELIERVLALRGRHRALSAEARQWRLYDLCQLGRLDDARAEELRLRQDSRELQQPLFQHVAVAWEGVFAELAGDVAETERLAEESFALGTRAQAYDARSIRAAKLFALYRWQGRLEELREDVEGLGTGRTALPAWRAALCLHEVLTGRRDAGARHTRALALNFDLVPRDFFWLSAATVLAEAVVLCDDALAAKPVYDAMAPYASRHTQHSFGACWGSVERQLGLLAGTLGRPEAAEAHLRAALAANRATGAPVLTAVTECDLGELLARGDRADRERASELGAAAEARVRPLGLAVLAARAAALRG